MLKIW